jgi:hypothetical protein
LREAIKETGDYTVPVRLHREVTVEIPVIVTGEGEAQRAAASSAPAETVEAKTTEAVREDAAEGSPAEGAESASTVE